MCGIVGIYSKSSSGLFSTDLALFKDMLVWDSVRGEDSTGAFTGNSSGNYSLVKLASVPHLLYMTAEWQKFETNAVKWGKFVVGHNRAATRGKIENENAHPFLHENIILVHNGSLEEHSNLNKESTVDSHAIAVALNNNESPEEILKIIKGAYTLVWFDLRDNTLKLVTNGTRPLVIFESPNLIFFGSEDLLMKAVIYRKIGYNETFPDFLDKFTNYKIEPQRVYQIIDGTVKVFPKYEVEVPNVPTTYTKYVSNDESSKPWKTRVSYKTPPYQEKVIFKVGQALAGTTKFTGKALFPLRYLGTDVVTTSLSQEDAELVTISEGQFLSMSLSSVHTTNCGTSLIVTGDIDYPTTVQTFDEHLPSDFVDAVTVGEKCSRCSLVLNLQESELQKTKIKYHNKGNIFTDLAEIKVLCPECMAKLIGAQQHKNEIRKIFNEYSSVSKNSGKFLSEVVAEYFKGKSSNTSSVKPSSTKENVVHH